MISKYKMTFRFAKKIENDDYFSNAIICKEYLILL